MVRREQWRDRFGRVESIPIYDGRFAGQFLPHLRPGNAQLLVFNGKRGNGKTTSLMSYIEVREPRVLLLDPHDDFGVVRKSDSLESALDDLSLGEPCRRRVVPMFESESAYDYGEAFFNACFDHLRDSLLVVNEIALWSKMVATGALIRLVTQGRRLGIRIACDAQKLSLVPYIVQSECTELVTFKVTRPRDIRAVEEWSDEGIAQNVKSLAVGECMVIDL